MKVKGRRAVSLPRPSPTPYPDVNTILHELLSSVRATLGNHFVGMYLYGSLALGDFTPGRSDIDFIVVTDVELSDELVSALQVMHARLASSGLPWAKELEGSYIPRDALRHYDPAHTRHPHLGTGERAPQVEQHDMDWVIQRHVLRERGVVVAGPAIAALIDPVSPDELRRAVADLMSFWWEPMVHDPTRLQQSGYPSYAVLTMCRVLYTLHHGTVVSKPVAARWAKEMLGARWGSLIDHALDWRHGMPDGNVKETQDLIRYTVERCRQL